MTLKTNLMGRFGNRGDRQSSSADDSQLSTVEGRRSKIYELVSGSILLRQIELVGDHSKLTLIATDKTLCKISLSEQGTTIFENDFTLELSEEEQQAKAQSLTLHLNRFLDNADTFSIEFADADDSYSDSLGITSEALLNSVEVATKQPVLMTAKVDTPVAEVPAPKEAGFTPFSARYTAAPKTNSTEKPPAVTKPAPSVVEPDSLPYSFLDASRQDIRAAVYYSKDSTVKYAGKRKTDTEIDASDFAGVEAWREKMAPLLGEKMMFVLILENPSQTYAISTDGKTGVGIELARPKLGQLCQAWQKTHRNSNK